MDLDLIRALADAFVFHVLPVLLGVFVLTCWVLYLLHSCYARIPERFRKLDPGLVWLLLIPCFNLAWSFVVARRLSASFKAYFETTERTDTGDCGLGLGVVLCICQIASHLTAFSLSTLPLTAAYLVLLAIYLAKVVSLRNRIGEPYGEAHPVRAFTAPSLEEAEECICVLKSHGIEAFQKETVNESVAMRSPEVWLTDAYDLPRAKGILGPQSTGRGGAVAARAARGMNVAWEEEKAERPWLHALVFCLAWNAFVAFMWWYLLADLVEQESDWVWICLLAGLFGVGLGAALCLRGLVRSRSGWDILGSLLALVLYGPTLLLMAYTMLRIFRHGFRLLPYM